MWHDLWDADHRSVSSVNLTGSPAQTGRICAESYFRLLSDEGRPWRTAGDDHHAISDRPTVELESGRTSCPSSGTSCGGPLLDWTKMELSSPDQQSHEHQHAEKSAQISGRDVRIGPPVLMNWLDL